MEGVQNVEQISLSKPKQDKKISQDSYDFRCRLLVAFFLFRGRPMGAGLNRRPTRVSILLMNRSDPNGCPLKVEGRILLAMASSSGSRSSFFHRSPVRLVGYSENDKIPDVSCPAM